MSSTDKMTERCLREYTGIHTVLGALELRWLDRSDDSARVSGCMRKCERHSFEIDIKRVFVTALLYELFKPDISF